MAMSAESFLQRATAYLEGARDMTQSAPSRYEAFDTSRALLLDARRAHAPPQSLLPIFIDLLALASNDPSHVVRIVVPQAIEDFCYRDMKSFVPCSTSHLMRSLHDDHVLVIKRAVRTMTTLFRKLIGFAVHVGISPQSDNGTVEEPRIRYFPEARLNVWFQMQEKALSYIETATDEGLRKGATKFAETVVLALSYSGGSASPEHFTLEYIVKRGTTSSLLDVIKLEQQGVRCVKTVANLVHQSLDGIIISKKPNEHENEERGLPAASFMTAIFVFGNLVKRRPKLIDVTLPPLLTIVSAITGSHNCRPSHAFHSLSVGQQVSIQTMLRLTLLALRGYAHSREEKWNVDINMSISSLATYERDLDSRRKERTEQRPGNVKAENIDMKMGMDIKKMEAVMDTKMGRPGDVVDALSGALMGKSQSSHILPSHGMQPAPHVTPMPLHHPNMPPPQVPPNFPPHPPPHHGGLRAPPSHVTPPLGNEIAKRPRSGISPIRNDAGLINDGGLRGNEGVMRGNGGLPDRGGVGGSLANVLGPRLPASEGYAVCQALIRSMPPLEVVNFIMTRILLNIPPVETLPVIDTSHVGSSRKRTMTPLHSSPGAPLPALSTTAAANSDNLNNNNAYVNKRRKINNTNNTNNNNNNDASSPLSPSKTPSPSSSTSNAVPTPVQSAVVMKRQKRSRFGGGGADTLSTSTTIVTGTSTKKVVRKAMPAVVPARLSEESRDRLITICCRRILQREFEARVSGAGPLRLQLLARIISDLIVKRKKVFDEFCDEVFEYLVTHIDTSIPLVLACLHSLAVGRELLHLAERRKQQNGSSVRMIEDLKMESEKMKTQGNLVEEMEKKSEMEIVKMEVDVEVEGEKKKIVTVKENGKVEKKNAKGKEEKDGDDTNDKDMKGVEKSTEEDGDLNRKGKEEDNGNGKDEEMSDIAVINNETEQRGNSDNINKEDGEEMQVQLHNANEDDEVLLEDDDDNDDDEDLKNSRAEGMEGYERMFCNILNMLRKKEEIEGRTFGRIISEAPIISEKIIEIMDEMCKDASSIKKGMESVCIVVMKRGGEDRRKCLSLLFELTCNDDDSVRGRAVRLIANSMFVNDDSSVEAKKMIEDNAIQRLDDIVNLVDSVGDGGDDDETMKRLERSCTLMIALCGQKHEIVKYVVSAFVKLRNEKCREVIKKGVGELAKHVGMESKSLIQLVDGTLLQHTARDNEKEKGSDGAEELALCVLQSGSGYGSGDSGLMVKAGMKRYEECGNMELVLAVVEGLKRDDVIRLLGKIVEYSYSSEGGEERFKQVLQKISSEHGNVKMNGNDILIQLHKLDTESVALAIKSCFESKTIFEQGVIAQAIQQMIDDQTNALPDLLMRTIILARIYHPGLESYLIDPVMKSLVAKRIWKRKILWEGFLKYCIENKKSAIRLLLTLPAPQLEDALARKEELKSLFKDVNNSKNLRKIPSKPHRKVILAALKKKSSS